MSEAPKVYPQLKLNEYVDDLHNHIFGNSQEVLLAAPKVVTKLKSVIR